MTGKDRQDRLASILEEALELPRARRGAFIAEACGEDRGLFAEIVELLSREGGVSGSVDAAREAVSGLPGSTSDGALDSAASALDLDELRELLFGEPEPGKLEVPAFLPRPDAAKRRIVETADDGAGEGRQPAADNRPDRARATSAPESVGPYKILEMLGEGGMGVVYLAEQQKPVRRRVALKLIKTGMDTRDVVARFEAERQALALMDHPNIARVHDAGATDDGRPYFAMEHIRGVPLGEYCDRHRLPLRRRLELFTQVCKGVEHAHRRGIIHRDLKPSNVLVSTPDQAPVAKIIDFGVARATNQRLTEKTLYTEIGRAVGTPAYMSPEQAELTGEDVDHRTDVYSLGVMLYELLVGEPPLDPELLAKAGFDEILRQIREEDPPTPSTRWTRLNIERVTLLAAQRNASPGEMVGMFHGDLDWITMKAMEKERERRYRSASHLADDIVRHLAGDPVEAGPPGVVYRLGKYVRKNRVFVLAGSAVIVALTVGLVVSLVFFVDARRERRNAQEQRDKAGERLADFNRVSLSVDLEEMTATADRLWPVTSEKTVKLTEWLDGARKLASRRDGLETALQRLRNERALPYSEAQRQKDRDANKPQNRTWEFANAQDRWWHRMLVGLLDELGSFVEATIPDVQRRLDFAASLREKTLEGDVVAAKWREAIGRIGASKRYGDALAQRLTPQEGLIPLGPDPSSGLEEFAHLQSGQPALRGEDGRLDFREETGIVLVLIPGGSFLMGAEKEARLGVEISEADGGFVVEKVREPSPAATLGVEPGDVLLEVDGAPIEAAAELAAALAPLGAGAPLEVEVRRGGERKTLSGKVEWNVDPQADSDEGPVHAVTIGAFFLSKHEMTQGQWERFTGTNPSAYGPGTSHGGKTIDLRHPVENVSWEDCERELTRLGLGLPAEAQWEYATRAGNFTRWWTGNDPARLETAGNVADQFCKQNGGSPDRKYEEWNDGHTVHAPVGSFQANAFGLHDVHGNVREWCEDVYSVSFYGKPEAAGPDPVSTKGSGYRVLRGGGCLDDAGYCRSALRLWIRPGNRVRTLGFRPSRPLH